MKIEELKELREKHPKSQRGADENVQEIVQHLVTNESDKPFVFISYKSDDWYIVLHEIVFTLVHDYGLNVYFDGSFDSHLSHWVNQFRKNMEDENCRAVLSFRSDRYDCSYATLMEVMYSRRALCKKQYVGESDLIPTKLLPINLTPSTMPPSKVGKEDTGLGAHFLPDGEQNDHSEQESFIFNTSFIELAKAKEDPLGDEKYLITLDPQKPEFSKFKLTKKACFRIMSKLFAGKANDNPYLLGEDERSKFFANVTTMLCDIDPGVFDSDRARLKPGERYVPKSGATTKEPDKPGTAPQPPSPPTPPDDIPDTPKPLPGPGVSLGGKPKPGGGPDSGGGPVPESGTRRTTGNGYDASFTYITVKNSKDEAEYKITLLKGSKVKVDSHIKTGWKYDRKHRPDIDENSGILKKDIPNLTKSAAESIIKGNSCSGKAIQNLIENADEAVSDAESDPEAKEPETVLPQEPDVLDTAEELTDEDPVPAAQKTGNVCRITGSDYDASFIYTTVINSKNETEYRITLLKDSKVKLASHIKTGWKYDKKHRSDIDENNGLLKNDIPDLTTSAAECIIKGNSCSGKAIRILIGEAESKVT